MSENSTFRPRVPEEPVMMSHGPSRTECEEAVRRILITEMLESGQNLHFKNSSDFMPYFEALYPKGPGLRKQVQRAIKALNMPKDKNGYYMVHKTKEQAEEDAALSHLLNKDNVTIKTPAADATLSHLFLETETHDPTEIAYLAKTISETASAKPKYLTMIRCENGILFLTYHAEYLKEYLERMLEGK